MGKYILQRFPCVPNSQLTALPDGLTEKNFILLFSIYIILNNLVSLSVCSNNPDPENTFYTQYMIWKHSCCYSHIAGTEPLVLIKCYNFAHHSLALSLFLENFPCGFKSHGFHYLIVNKWGWVFVETLWNSRVRVCLHTRQLNSFKSTSPLKDVFSPCSAYNGSASKIFFFVLFFCPLPLKIKCILFQ